MITRSVEPNTLSCTHVQGHRHYLSSPLLGISPLFYKEKVRASWKELRDFPPRKKSGWVCVGGRHRQRVGIPTAGDGTPRAASIRPPGTVRTQRGDGERAGAGTSLHCPPCHVLPGHPRSRWAPAFGIKPRWLSSLFLFLLFSWFSFFSSFFFLFFF